ncbi:MAG TPA: hypothetical protein VF426_05570 [Marmoricola sp.]
MSEPMRGPKDNNVGDLLERAIRDLPHIDLVGGALSRAGRARKRRRAAVAGGVAAAVAAAVGISVALQPGATKPVPTHQIHTPKVFWAPELPADIIEPSLDLAKALRAPADVKGLPTSLTPHDAVDTPLKQALMVTKQRRGDQKVFYALDTSLKWHRLHVDAPADIGNGLGPMLDTNALSPDGTEVALRGAKNMYVVDLATGRTTAKASGGGFTAQWSGGHILTVAEDFRAQQTSDGTTLITVGKGGFTEKRNGSLLVRAKVRPRDSYGAMNPVATKDHLGVYADPTFTGRKHSPGPGLLVLDRPSYGGVAFLPLSGWNDDFFRGADRTAVVPHGWLDQDTLLFSDATDSFHSHPPEAKVVHYLLWNTDTGTVTHVASVDQYWRDSSWASRVLDR